MEPANRIPVTDIVSATEPTIIIPDWAHVDLAASLFVQESTEDEAVNVFAKLDKDMMVNKGADVDLVTVVVGMKWIVKVAPVKIGFKVVEVIYNPGLLGRFEFTLLGV